VLSETAEPPPPVAGAPEGTAVDWTAGAVAAVVAYSPASLLLGLLVAYSPASLLLGLLVAYSVGFAELLVHGGGVTHVDGAAALDVAAADGFALEPPPMVMPGMSEEDEPMPGIDTPGAMFMPGIDDEEELDDDEEELVLLVGFVELIALVLLELELLLELGFAELLVHGGGVTQVDGAAALDDEVAAELGLVVAMAVAVAAAVGVAVTGATVVAGAPPSGTPTGSLAGGAPAGGTPAPAVEEVESFPALSPINDRTTARSTIATSAPITQAVLFGLSLSGPDWSSDVESVGVSDMFLSRWRAQLVRNARRRRVHADHGRRKDLVWFHMHQ
jgi:hypothetical protein